MNLIDYIHSINFDIDNLIDKKFF